MQQKKVAKKRTGIITLAIFVSIILYLAGVFSGIYSNRLSKAETQKDISSFKEETKQDIGDLREYIVFLDSNLKSMQLEQIFIETLSQDEMCSFLGISLEELVKQLNFYWSRLPFRLEEYERNNKPSEEYLLLKEQYTHLSIRTWLLAKKQYDKCRMNIVHGLYFYSADCEECVKQGEQIDKLSKMVSNAGSSMIMFPVDINSEESIIQNLKRYYGIHSTPAIIINDKVFQGRLFKASELVPLNLTTKNGR